MRVFYINLDRSENRRLAMEAAFPRDKLIRVPGNDGWALWSTGEFDENGKAVWKQVEREKLIEEGILHLTSKLSPAAVGCNLGHRAAINAFLSTDDEWCIILEDDVEPTVEGMCISNITPPKNYDMLYLCSADHPGDRLRLREGNRVWLSRTLMGYMINRRAAEIALSAMFPIVFLFDFQISVCCFKLLAEHGLDEKWAKRGVPLIDEKFEARAKPTEGWIRHSELSKTSTMTVDGKKPWMDPWRDIR